MTKVRCMLSETGLPENFWVEETSTACYLINLSPSTAIDMIVPNENGLDLNQIIVV